MVDPIIGLKRLTKALMDGGSGLNIMYTKMLDEIDMPITFRVQFNYSTETLTFEVVGLPRTFHAILGRPCYAKFLAVRNYTYLKLKIPAPMGSLPLAPPSSTPMSARSSAAVTPQ
ncbi:uncharacterized protein [Miscanthus floridulus]|uniref:uncharacterized protein n=1 Tax=Miscanthus floridulus TaxID=154761 RepID=UPI003457C790